MFLFFFVLCYYAILTRQFTVSFFCLVPVHKLSGLIWKQDSSHLLKILYRILVLILYAGKTILWLSLSSCSPHVILSITIVQAVPWLMDWWNDGLQLNYKDLILLVSLSVINLYFHPFVQCSWDILLVLDSSC